MATTAIDTVLSTFELLDNILACLDWRTAILAQRVSRHWSEVVKTGHSVQHKLGFKALEGRRFWALRWNSLNIFTEARRLGRQNGEDDPSQLIVVQGHATSLFAQMSTLAVGRLWAESFGNEYMFKLSQIPPALLKDDLRASWRRMQITQPPTTVLDISTAVYFRDALMYRRIPGHQPPTRLEDLTGITLGTVLAVVKQWQAEAPELIDWNKEFFTLTTVRMIDDNDFFRRLSCVALTDGD